MVIRRLPSGWPRPEAVAAQLRAETSTDVATAFALPCPAAPAPEAPAPPPSIAPPGEIRAAVAACLGQLGARLRSAALAGTLPFTPDLLCTRLHTLAGLLGWPE